MNVSTSQSSPRLLHELLDRTAECCPQKTAIIHDEGLITYEQLATESRQIAVCFKRLGCGRGDRIALVLPNSIPLVTALMAASRIGAIFFVVNVSTKTYGLRYLIEDAEPTIIVTTRQRNQEELFGQYCKVLVLEDDWPLMLQRDEPFKTSPLISHDVACLIYTSGSTGRPKAIISSHANMIFAATAIQKCLHYREADIIGNFLPMAFDVGLYQVLMCFQVGATLALGQGTDVGPGLLKKLRDWQVTGLPAVPSLVSLLVRLSRREAHRLPKLRFITNTGSHLSHTIISDIHILYPACAVFVMFGLTECKRVSILSPADYQWKRTSVGRPLPDTECFIVDTNGQALPPGEVGELVVRGPHVMLGYWRAPDINAKRFRTWGPGLERVLFTGDMCLMDADGFLYFRGRSDDIYKQGDHRVSSLEIEAAVCDIVGIYQAAVILPNTRRGAVLFVKGGDITCHDTVRAELRQRLEDYKIPQHIVMLKELPLTANGKIDKQYLQRYFDEEGIPL